MRSSAPSCTSTGHTGRSLSTRRALRFHHNHYEGLHSAFTRDIWELNIILHSNSVLPGSRNLCQYTSDKICSTLHYTFLLACRIPFADVLCPSKLAEAEAEAACDKRAGGSQPGVPQHQPVCSTCINLGHRRHGQRRHCLAAGGGLLRGGRSAHAGSGQRAGTTAQHD